MIDTSSSRIAIRKKLSKIVGIYIGKKMIKRINLACFIELNLNEFIKYLFITHSLCY